MSPKLDSAWVRKQKNLLLFSMVLYIVGFGALVWANWEVAIGVFLVLWANNIQFDK
jgi:hypothetical protein